MKKTSFDKFVVIIYFMLYVLNGPSSRSTKFPLEKYLLVLLIRTKERSGSEQIMISFVSIVKDIIRFKAHNLSNIS